MTKPDHSYDPRTFSLGVTDGIVGRDATQGEGEVMTYKCNTCPQYTEDPIAHEEQSHSEVVQSRNLSLLRPKGIVTRVLAPIAIVGASLLGLSGCGKDLTPQDFATANWIEYNNPDNTFYGAYLAENITHNQDNLHLYDSEVKEYNKKRNRAIKGLMFLPDLDRDSIVGGIR